MEICGALRNLVSFVQFKKREENPWRNVNFSKVAGFTKINTPPWLFFTFFKLYKWYRIAQRITYHSTSHYDSHVNTDKKTTIYSQ